MLRKLNRMFQDYMRPKRLAMGKWIWDRKDKVNIDTNLLDKKELIESENIKSILFLRYDGKIGDMVINTLMFREIKKQYPHIKIGVVARGIAGEIIEKNPYIDVIYNYEKSDSKAKRLAGEIEGENYDLLIDFTDMLRVNQMKFINLCKAKINMGINKKDWNLFDINLEYYETEKHIKNRYGRVLEILGIKDIDLSYDLHLTESQKDKGKRFRETIKEERVVVINPYGASKHRTFNEHKIKELIELFSRREDTAVTLVYPPDKREDVEKISKMFSERVYFNGELKSITDTITTLEYADLIVTPDTSIVHIGVALDKEMIAVYRTDEGTGENNSLVWGPGSEKVIQIFAKSNEGAGEESDINEFDINEILRVSKEY